MQEAILAQDIKARFTDSTIRWRFRMPIFRVTHIIGVQGYGEEEIVTRGIEAETALEAIKRVLGQENWTERDFSWDNAAMLNPEAPNRSEEYCDYYMAELEEEYSE
jgi:hypothetical protein